MPSHAKREPDADRWTHAPAPLEAETLTRLLEVCRSEPRIAEAWVTGSRRTFPRGSPPESTDIGLILEPAFPGNASDDEWDFMERLLEAEVPGHGMWFLTTREIVETHVEQCIHIYSRG